MHSPNISEDSLQKRRDENVLTPNFGPQSSLIYWANGFGWQKWPATREGEQRNWWSQDVIIQAQISVEWMRCWSRFYFGGEKEGKEARISFRRRTIPPSCSIDHETGLLTIFLRALKQTHGIHGPTKSRPNIGMNILHPVKQLIGTSLFLFSVQSRELARKIRINSRLTTLSQDQSGAEFIHSVELLVI